MSAISKLFAIQPTKTVDQVLVEPIETAAALRAGYTNIVSLEIGDSPYLCAYNKTTGTTDLYLVTEAEPWILAVESRIDLSGGPWDSLTTFVLGNDPYLLTYRAKDGMLNFYRVG